MPQVIPPSLDRLRLAERPEETRSHGAFSSAPTPAVSDVLLPVVASTGWHPEPDGPAEDSHRPSPFAVYAANAVRRSLTREHGRERARLVAVHSQNDQAPKISAAALSRALR